MKSIEASENILGTLGFTRWKNREAVQTPVEGQQWKSLQSEVASCRLCDLCKTRKQTVFGVGNQQADLVIIGEAPGFYEDQQGEPFVGRAGQLLNSMLQSMGLQRESVYIANVLKCRPPENRDPRPEEVLRCTPYLRRQLELLQPKCILAVGRIAAHFLLDCTTPLGKMRGKEYQYGPHNTPLYVTYHPAYLLRNPADKRHAWTDLQLVQKRLE